MCNSSTAGERVRKNIVAGGWLEAGAAVAEDKTKGEQGRLRVSSGHAGSIFTGRRDEMQTFTKMRCQALQNEVLQQQHVGTCGEETPCDVSVRGPAMVGGSH